MAEDLGGKVGAPFPRLPAELIGRRLAQRLDQVRWLPAKMPLDPGAGGGNRTHPHAPTGVTHPSSDASKLAVALARGTPLRATTPGELPRAHGIHQAAPALAADVVVLHHAPLPADAGERRTA